jgi:hypothetical protein
VSFEFGQENNNTMDAKSYGKLTVKLPLGNKQKFTNCGDGDGDGDGGTPLFCAIIISFTILLLRSAQASAPKSPIQQQ